MINILSKKLTTCGILLIVIAIGAFLRFYQLGSNPPSLNWDEASLGYNAYSILQTGADEYGNKFPLSIRSFDDYKPPLYTYLTIPFIKIFGLNEFAVRVPSAFIGVLSILAIYFLVKELLQKWDKKYQERIALVSAFFLAISPWHLQFSRVAFEGQIGLFFLISGLLFFLKALRNGSFFYLSSTLFLLSLYSYHSFRLLVPLLLLVLLIVFWKSILNFKKQAVISLMMLFLLSFPIWSSFLGETAGTGARLSMVTIFSDPTVIDSSIERIDYDKSSNDYVGTLFHNRRVIYALAIAKGYLDHFNPDFLFFHGDGGVQHHAVDVGMLYFWDLPFILAGIYYLLKRFNRFILILFISFLLSPIPSAITTGTPHPVRAIGMVLGFHIFAAIGVVFFWGKIMLLRSLFIRVVIIIVVLIFFMLDAIYYLHQYYIHTPIEYGYFWQYGNKETIEYARQNENKYTKIIMTYRIDQPYIYYLFYNKIDPIWYQENWSEKGNIGRFERKIGKYEFRYIDFNKDSKEKGVLLIGTPGEIPQSAKVIKEIKYLDGSIVYRIAVI